MSPEAISLLEQLARDGKAPARKRKIADELIATGLAMKSKSGLVLTPAGKFATQSSN